MDQVTEHMLQISMVTSEEESNHVSCSANRLFFPCCTNALLSNNKKAPLYQTKPACQVYSGGQEAVLTRPRLYQTGNMQGRTPSNTPDINMASDNSGRKQVEPF